MHQDAAERLDTWSFPTLRENAVACVVLSRTKADSLAGELDEAVKQLSRQFDVSVKFHGSERIDETGESRPPPERGQFASDSAFVP